MDELSDKLILSDKEIRKELPSEESPIFNLDRWIAIDAFVKFAEWMLSNCDEHEVFTNGFDRCWNITHGECLKCQDNVRKLLDEIKNSR